MKLRFLKNVQFLQPQFRFEFLLQFTFTMIEESLLMWNYGPYEIENLYNPSAFSEL